MKKKEVDLTKAHSDLYKSEPKSNSSTIIYTTAGWATVTQDGTIIGVIDAFQGGKQEIIESFVSRNEIEENAITNENLIVNAKDIGLKESSPRNDDTDKDGELTTRSALVCSNPQASELSVLKQPIHSQTELIIADPTNAIILNKSDFDNADCEWIYCVLRDTSSHFGNAYVFCREINNKLTDQPASKMEIYAWKSSGIATGDMTQRQFPYTFIDNQVSTIVDADPADPIVPSPDIIFRLGLGPLIDNLTGKEIIVAVKATDLKATSQIEVWLSMA